MSEKIERLFGKIAVVNEFLTKDEFEVFLQLKDSQAPDEPIGRLMVDKGILTERQFDAICKVHKAQVQKLEIEVPPGFYDLEKSSEAEVVDKGAGKPYCDLPRGEEEFMAGGMKAYLRLARQMGASDLHISPNVEPFVRVHGKIVYLRQTPLPPERTKELLYEVLTDKLVEHLEENWDVDFGFSDPKLGRFRVNIYRQRLGLGGCFRVIQKRIRSIHELGLPEIVETFTAHHQGIVLVTGTAGSGKSTTMAALVDLVNTTRKDHIIAMEEPIEFVHESKSCNVTQREVRKHTKDFQIALRASLREDPDVIVVGEMRDLETISMAITAAETGHLVFGTLHTTNSTRTVDRILDVFPPKEQPQIRAMVSESLRAVVSQQLVPRADGAGRVLAVEILISTPAVANIIRDFKTFQLPSVLQTGKALGMISMDDSLKDLLERGLITIEEARYRAENPSHFSEEQ